MGQYLAPPNLENIQTKCAIIFYPDDDGAFFLNAVRGQLSELARPFIWEGDREKQDAIAQLFTATDLMTDDVFFGLDCELIKLITGDEDMNINVNCNCCGTGSGDTLICYGTDGQPVITTQPYTPDDSYIPPTGGDWPMDPETQSPPPAFETWEEYDANACAAANAYYELFVFLVAAAHGVVDLAVNLATAIIAVAALFPAQVEEVLASGFIAKAAEAIVKLATHSEDAKDWIEDLQGYLASHQAEIVCSLYTHRYDIPGMKVDLINRLMAYMVSILTLDAGDLYILRNFLESMMPFDVLFSWYTNAAEWTLLTVDPIDCSACNQFSFEWTENSGDGECTVSPMSFVVDGQTITYSGEISKYAPYGAYEWAATASNDENEIQEMSGVQVTFSNDIQTQNLQIVVTLFYGTGQYLQEFISPGFDKTFDCSDKTITSVEVKVTIANYNAPCPQALGGQFSWSAG